MKTAAIIGASGLVGRSLLHEMLNHSFYKQINLIVRRRPTDLPNDTRIQVHISDFSDAHWQAALQVDHVFCTLGTTIKIAGSQAAFRAVDFDLVLSSARASQQHRCQHFLVVSAMGANATSTIFYNRVKGEMENALQQLALTRLSIFRPSLLTGPRAELRPMEKIMGLFGWLAPRRWRPVAATAVARAMLRIANQETTQRPIVIESDTIALLAQTP